MIENLSFIPAAQFYELTILVVLAAATGFCGVLLLQPVVASLSAAVAGPSALNIVQSH